MSDKKVGVVNVSKILDKSRKARSFGQELQGIAQDWQKKIQITEQLMQQIHDKLGKIDESSSMDNMFALERERRLYEMELNHLKERSELDLNLRAQRFQAQVAEEIAPMISDIAKKNKLDVVLNAVGPQLLYHDSGIDITDEVIAAYDGSK